MVRGPPPLYERVARTADIVELQSVGLQYAIHKNRRGLSG
jgi:hypothetical protein